MNVSLMAVSRLVSFVSYEACAFFWYAVSLPELPCGSRGFSEGFATGVGLIGRSCWPVDHLIIYFTLLLMSHQRTSMMGPTPQAAYKYIDSSQLPFLILTIAYHSCTPCVDCTQLKKKNSRLISKSNWA